MTLPAASPDGASVGLTLRVRQSVTRSVTTTLPGSADDRAVTLPAASADATTLTAQGKRAPSSVEEALRAAGGEAGRYVEQGIIGRGGMGEVALCVERDTQRQV